MEKRITSGIIAAFWGFCAHGYLLLEALEKSDPRFIILFSISTLISILIAFDVLYGWCDE